MSIGKKLYYGFGALITMMALLFLVSLAARWKDKSARENTGEIGDIRSLVTQNNLALNSYLLTGSPDEVKKIADGDSRLLARLDQFKDKVNTGQHNALDKLQTAERDWMTNFANPVIEKRKQVDGGNATVAELQIFYLQQDPGTWLETLNTPLDQVQKSINASSDTTSTATFLTSVVFFIFALIAGVLIAQKISKSITTPLSHLILVAREIGESGDLDQRIELDRQDEIGDLARTFNNMMTYLKEMAAISEAIAGGDLTVAVEPRSKSDTLAHAFSRMTEGLRSLVKNVRDGATQVASGSNQVADASDDSAKVSVQASSAIDEVTSTMHEMSVNVQNMVKNTQTQASSVSETSASIDQMVASIQRVADTSKVLLDISQRSRDEVQSGIGTMEKTTEGLGRINESIGVSSGIIAVLGQRADDIGKIVEVIDDLAEQTNLLALNAAIEAARAGEHGLGFAVVADEVRKLAEKSAQSTREISELIESIQKEARKAVENMEKSTTIVNDGLLHGTDLNTALKKISNVVTEVYKFAQEIGAATNEQSHGSSQIAKATTRLNEITHEINSSVEEQASGAQAVVRAMEKMRELVQRSSSGSTELAASAEQMSKMSRSMLEAMDRFVLENMQPQRDNRAGQRRNEEQSGRSTPTPQYATASAGGNYN